MTIARVLKTNAAAKAQREFKAYPIFCGTKWLISKQEQSQSTTNHLCGEEWSSIKKKKKVEAKKYIFKNNKQTKNISFVMQLMFKCIYCPSQFLF